MFNLGRALGVVFSLISIIAISVLVLLQPGGADVRSLTALFYYGLPSVFTLLGFLLWRPQRSLTRPWLPAIRAAAVAGFTVAMWMFALAGVNLVVRYATTALFVALLSALIAGLVRARNRLIDGRLVYLALTIVIMSSVYLALLLLAFQSVVFRFLAISTFLPLSLFLYLAYRDGAGKSDPEATFLVAAGTGNMCVATTIGAWSIGIFYLPLVLTLLISGIIVEAAVAEEVSL